MPISREGAAQLATPPPGIDKSLWLYELCRLLTNKINTIIVSFFADSPPCSASTCPEMRASEWQYLCAVHDPPKPCCAIDYCCHTLDWAANMLTSTKHFPSRLTLGTGASAAGPTCEAPSTAASQQPLRNLTNIFRRLYRIFAHAWYQHKDVFWSVEGGTGLYLFFKTVCDQYQLIPEDNYTVPAEAEGLEPRSGGPTKGQEGGDKPQLSGKPSFILKKEGVDSPGDTRAASHGATKSEPTNTNEPPPPYSADSNSSAQLNPASSTTRRHKQSPSIGSAVDTVPEEEEEEGAAGLNDEAKPSLFNSNLSPVDEDGAANAEDEPMTEEKTSVDQDEAGSGTVPTGGEHSDDVEMGEATSDSEDSGDTKDEGGGSHEVKETSADAPAVGEDNQSSTSSGVESDTSKKDDAVPSLGALESQTAES